MVVTPAALLVALRARGVTVEAHGDRLRLAPADRVTPEELADLRTLKAEVLALLVDLESLEADGTAALWRGLYEDLSEGARERLVVEVASGDRLALLAALVLDLLTRPSIAGRWA